MSAKKLEKTFMKLPVIHLMRTYGSHGGEQQLSQYFGAEPHGKISETFVFVYRDPECSQLFATRSPRLEQLSLYRWPIATGKAKAEFVALLPLLPWLQLRFFILVWWRRPAVIFVHGFQAALVAWPAAMLLRGVRWGYMHRTTKSSTGSNPIFKLIYWPYHVVAGNSQAVAASLAPLVGIDRLIALENGIDLHRFDERSRVHLDPLPNSAGLVLVSVGRLLPHKCQAILIDAFDQIADRFPDLTLWLVGDGPQKEMLARRAAASPAASRIYLLGRREDVPAVLVRAHVFVNASSWEGMSNAVLEGMAAGLCSVVAEAPGVTECHIDGVTGIIVQRDATCLADALERVLSDAELRQRMGIAARKRITEYYSMTTSRKRYLEVFERLTGCDVCAES